MTINEYFVVSCQYSRNGYAFHIETVAEMLKRHRTMFDMQQLNNVVILGFEMSKNAAHAAVEEYEYIFSLPERDRVINLKRWSTKPIERPTCPVCGEVMVWRIANNDKNAVNQYWGCWKFPSCNGTING